MNSTLYKRRRLRQKPHILTIEQSRELGQLAGNKVLKHVTDQGLIPYNLFRLRKRKLEKIYKYLENHRLIHDKAPTIDSLQTHQLAEYLLNIIYPGYPACKAKNQAYTDYRACREKDLGPIPLAYDYVPTTQVYERLDELYRIDVNWQQNTAPCIDVPIPLLKKSMDRIRAGNFKKSNEHVEYHLYFWNSTRTLLKPQCKSLLLNHQEIWSKEKEQMVNEGFMHIDITDKLKYFIQLTSRKSIAINDRISKEALVNHCQPSPNHALKITPHKSIKFEIKLADDDESNISHISISAVTKRTTDELVSDLYLQATTECIARSIQTSSFPLDTQQIAVHLLRQKNETKSLKSAEHLFMTCLSNSYSDLCHEQAKEIELIDPISFERIQHPIQSIHCNHHACFDAAVFFDHHADIQLWHCPICFVHIKSTEELRMDYTTKLALEQYAEEDKLLDTSETEIYTDEENTLLIATEGLKRPNTLCDRETKKRLCPLTHVM
ncbi:uncharacterized protein EV154DRAFT_605456 [Mucor mucedo]|uniref:uncharacterized protein n=1 Tax=Mucor mucedo TaxID=29922 RepID=UPI00221FF735|nr:uncharacterized protein EV154DRAFT_605456 [Mucor mucedo]KAI7887666.1 hypothetical protein EV154DRAFT_605456 [Mucor mucedo]